MTNQFDCTIIIFIKFTVFVDFNIRDEMQEIIVDESKEMLINGESHYETSVEIREEADKYKYGGGGTATQSRYFLSCFLKLITFFNNFC